MYWELEPIVIMDMIKEKNKRYLEELNLDLEKSWYEASLNSIGLNNPKKFPKKPIQIKEQKEDNRDLYNLIKGLKGKK